MMLLSNFAYMFVHFRAGPSLTFANSIFFLVIARKTFGCLPCLLFSVQYAVRSELGWQAAMDTRKIHSGLMGFVSGV